MIGKPAVDEDLAPVVTQLCLAHPRFPRRTIERLVERACHELPDAPAATRPDLVRLTAEEQLRYADPIC